LITPDLIPDEAAEWAEVSELVWDWKQCFLPRLRQQMSDLGRARLQASRGFVYAVSTMGITGTRDDVDVGGKDSGGASLQ
jgi:tryptophan synthase alpha chain